MSAQAALERLLLERSVTFGDFVLASGQRSSYYVDARKTTMSAEGLRLIGELGLQQLRARGWVAQAIGGLTMGADPVAYAIARASLDSPPILDAFSVRKAAKQHGTRQLIEGNFQPGAPVIVVEDVITSGGSAIQAIEAVRAAGGHVVGVLAVVDRGQGGVGAIASHGVEVVSLTTTDNLLRNRPL
ncbi:MAG: orotate phosphoribosyltransferase [Gemmatimonadales bacterium]